MGGGGWFWGGGHGGGRLGGVARSGVGICAPLLLPLSLTCSFTSAPASTCLNPRASAMREAVVVLPVPEWGGRGGKACRPPVSQLSAVGLARLARAQPHSLTPGVPVTSMLGLSRSAGPGGAPSDDGDDVVICFLLNAEKNCEFPTSKNAVLQTPGRARPRRRVAGGGVVGGWGWGRGANRHENASLGVTGQRERFFVIADPDPPIGRHFWNRPREGNAYSAL